MPGRIRILAYTIDARPAGKLSKCGHDHRHKIVKGQVRLVVKEPGGLGERGYCQECAEKMIKATIKQLEHALEALRL